MRELTHVVPSWLRGFVSAVAGSPALVRGVVQGSQERPDVPRATGGRDSAQSRLVSRSGAPTSCPPDPSRGPGLHDLVSTVAPSIRDGSAVPPAPGGSGGHPTLGEVRRRASGPVRLRLTVAVHDAISRRTAGRCEAAWPSGIDVRPGGQPCRNIGDELHLRDPAADPDRLIVDPDEVRLVCGPCHHTTHDAPERARAAGLTTYPTEILAGSVDAAHVAACGLAPPWRNR